MDAGWGGSTRTGRGVAPGGVGGSVNEGGIRDGGGGVFFPVGGLRGYIKFFSVEECRLQSVDADGILNAIHPQSEHFCWSLEDFIRRVQ